MRVLFLDFDGPLHPASAIVGLQAGVVPIAEAARQRALFRWLPHLEALLAGHDDVGIVVHSAWRAFASNSELREVLGALGERLLGVTSLEVDRYAGILLTVERFEIEQYLILDDDVQKFPLGLAQLLVAHPERGLDDPALRMGLGQWLRETACRREGTVPVVCAPAPARP